ncbi:hypothetical protein VTN00DRAFT_4139 [Thermoascus crustaceus]|uniref:uncharacterized protein n=1 Tax=Thermoascus crustaceus TaxID=5088 RepID=UPI00374384A0
MPPKRRGGGTATAAPKVKKGRQSKLAKENDITAEEENEIKEAFHLFSTTNEEFEDEKEGVIRTEDVRRALVALGLPPSNPRELSSILSALDPTHTGFVPYGPFLSIAAAKLHSRDADALSEEVDTAYRLFTRGTDGPITLGHLRRIARDLKEDSVGDDLLRDMILEANGGAGVQAGVTLEQFRDVMSRAGVF